MGIKISGLKKAFDGKTILDDLSCSFADKGLVRIAGPSGVGKTTLLRIIAGLDKDYEGEVICDGEIAYLFQEHRLLPWLSAIDNVTVASFEKADSDDIRRAEELLMRLGFSKDELALKPNQLSGGMKQRVAIARAMIMKSDILILDEPSKELDIELVKVLSELIVEASGSKLVLLVSHDPLLDTLPFLDTLCIG